VTTTSSEAVRHVGVGTRLVEIVVSGGVGALFGVPGGQTLPLYAASAAAGLRHLVMRDERNAATAADAFARLSGRVGVCDATAGPGITNLVSGLAEAYASSVPVLAIIADIPIGQEHLRRRSVAAQALDQRSVLGAVTKWFARVERPNALDDVVAHALRVATTGRPGPVALEIPEDVFLGTVEHAGEASPVAAEDFAFPRYRPAPDPQRLAAAVALLTTSSRPLLLAGGGATLSGGAAAVARLATELQIPVATTITGKGCLDERSALCAGVVGVFGSARAAIAAHRADVLVVIGANLDQLTTHRWKLPHAAQRVIHIDVDGEEVGRTGPVDVGIVADARSAAEALLAALKPVRAMATNWLAEQPIIAEPTSASEDATVPPDEVVRAIGDALTPGDIVVCDASLSSGWAAAHLRLAHGCRFIAPRGLAGIGWSCGGAIGARLAAPPEARVIVLAGDGGWGYGLSEVETAVRHQLDITYVILNNASLAWVRHAEQHMGIPLNSDFGRIDFAGVSRCMGGEGDRVDTIADFPTQLRHALGRPVPFVLDVRSSADASPVVPFSAIRRGLAQTEGG
jgi:acetolactate synthase I/II/III large subunit